MTPMTSNLSSITGQAVQLSFVVEHQDGATGRLVLTSIDSARVESRRRLETIHPANRFRAMAGLPPLSAEQGTSKYR